ncbi:MAG: hypothetical protein QM451_04240 [Bacillota bacterium]|jgi:hypothetical protein|nr:hypothetical protein [Bacillota bacterium]HHT89680.1 hypothetical protein [Bacillota bacterium]
MGIRRIAGTLLVLFVLSAPILAATLPRSLDDIPIYPGAVRDGDLDRYYRENTYVSDDVVFREIRAYRIDTILDDVAQYYLEYLQPSLGWPGEDPYFLAPGESLGPWYEPDFYPSRIFEDQYEFDTLIQDGKWIRTAFGQRPQWETDKWLAQVWFEWVIVSDEDELITHSILVEDEGYDWRTQTDFRATRLRLETTVIERDMFWDDDWDEDWGWDDDWEDDWEWDNDWEWGMDDDISFKEPTEEFLGIPFYPGMTFHAPLSQGMSMDDYHYYVFFASDPPEQVADFYARHLGKEPSFSEGGYLFALKGRLPLPDDGLAIQTNEIFAGFPQTMITVQKQMRD